VLRAQGPLWAMTALQRYKPGHRTHEPALALLTALAAHREALPALVGPTPPAWPASCCSPQRLSPALAAARRAASSAAGADAPLRVARVHCGGRGASSRARLAELNGDAVLLRQLQALCDADAAGDDLPPLDATVRLRPVPVDDPRVGLAGVGTAAHAARDLPAHAVLGPYRSWVTTPDEFDATVALRERAEYEAHAVRARVMPIAACSRADASALFITLLQVTTRTLLRLGAPHHDEHPLMFVACPPAVTDATCELNDWRTAPEDAERDYPGDGPNCELVRMHGSEKRLDARNLTLRLRSWRCSTAAGCTCSLPRHAPCSAARSLRSSTPAASGGDERERWLHTPMRTPPSTQVWASRSSRAAPRKRGSDGTL